MSQENVEAVRGLLAHWATRFALLLSLLAFGALGPVACDDDETATKTTPSAELRRLVAPNPPGADLFRLPARKHCGHLPVPPPGIDYPLIWVEVIKGRVPC